MNASPSTLEFVAVAAVPFLVCAGCWGLERLERWARRAPRSAEIRDAYLAQRHPRALMHRGRRR